MGPIDNALTGGHNWIHVKSNQLLWSSLQDFHTIIKRISQWPTFCQELAPDTPDYIGYCDISKLGAGGDWMSGSKFLKPTVGQLKFPQDIQNQVVSFSNPKGDITNSDLEIAGLLAKYLVLEHLTPSSLHKLRHGATTHPWSAGTINEAHLSPWLQQD